MTSAGGGTAVSCTGLGGEELMKYDSGLDTKTVGELRQELAAEVSLPSARLHLCLPDGTSAGSLKDSSLVSQLFA